MKKQHYKELLEIKKTMIDSLEQPDYKGYLQGDYICHEDLDITDKEEFIVNGEDDSVSYLVTIEAVEL